MQAGRLTRAATGVRADGATRPGAPRSEAPRSVTRLRTVAAMLVTGAILLAIAYLANRPADATGLTLVDLGGTPSGPAPVVGQAAPDLSGTAVDGTPFRLADLRGSPVWVTFGATWCQPCRAENPDIQAAFEAWRDRGLVVVQVYMGEDRASVQDYTGRVGLTYVRVPDPADRLATDYRILGIPTHFFIDREGILRQLKVGTLDREAMERTLDPLLR